MRIWIPSRIMLLTVLIVTALEWPKSGFRWVRKSQIGVLSPKPIKKWANRIKGPRVDPLERRRLRWREGSRGSRVGSRLRRGLRASRIGLCASLHRSRSNSRGSRVLGWYSGLGLGLWTMGLCVDQIFARVVVVISLNLSPFCFQNFLCPK
jgi:hypothetical protein